MAETFAVTFKTTRQEKPREIRGEGSWELQELEVGSWLHVDVSGNDAFVRLGDLRVRVINGKVETPSRPVRAPRVRVKSFEDVPIGVLR